MKNSPIILLFFSMFFLFSCSTLAIEENDVDDVVSTDEFQSPGAEQDLTADDQESPDDDINVDENVVTDDFVEPPDEEDGENEEEEEEEDEMEDAFTLFLKLLAAQK